MADDLWDITLQRLEEDEESNDCCECSLPYQELGDPARPLEFPTPSVFDCELTTVLALDHRTHTRRFVNSVLVRADRQGRYHLPPTDRAYLVRKKISKSLFGCVRVCLVLKRRGNVSPTNSNLHQYEYFHKETIENGDEDDPPWISTDEYVVVKISSWSKMRQALRTKHLDDPVREVAALQLVGNHHPHVLGCLECLQDDRNLYVIMPYGGPMNLHTKLFAVPANKTTPAVVGADPTQKEDPEEKARGLFRQLLLGMFHLQQKGICHRDLSLDNLLLDEEGRLRIFDLGMSLRVPFTDPLNEHGVTDASEGLCRRLMIVNEQGGRVMYLAPEVVSKEQSAMDGFATDLWSAGVILFVLLVGMAPFKFAQCTDTRYDKISRGKLKEILHTLNINISEEACDLLQSMFRRDPKDRLTLAEVMRHPWVLGERFPKQPVNTKTTVMPIVESSEASVTSSTGSTEERTGITEEPVPPATEAKNPKAPTRKLNFGVLKSAMPRPEARQTASSASGNRSDNRSIAGSSSASGNRSDNRSTAGSSSASGNRSDNRSAACSTCSASSGGSSVNGSDAPLPVMDQQGLSTSQDSGDEPPSPRKFKAISPPRRVKGFLGNFKGKKAGINAPKL